MQPMYAWAALVQCGRLNREPEKKLLASYTAVANNPRVEPVKSRSASTRSIASLHTRVRAPHPRFASSVHKKKRPFPTLRKHKCRRLIDAITGQRKNSTVAIEPSALSASADDSGGEPPALW